MCEESTLKIHCTSSSRTPAVRGQKVAPPLPYEWSARPPGVREEEVLYFLGGKNKPTSTPIIHSIFTYQYWECHMPPIIQEAFPLYQPSAPPTPQPPTHLFRIHTGFEYSCTYLTHVNINLDILAIMTW